LDAKNIPPKNRLPSRMRTVGEGRRGKKKTDNGSFRLVVSPIGLGKVACETKGGGDPGFVGGKRAVCERWGMTKL